jgi:hypothetical protein
MSGARPTIYIALSERCLTLRVRHRHAAPGPLRWHYGVRPGGSDTLQDLFR